MSVYSKEVEYPRRRDQGPSSDNGFGWKCRCGDTTVMPKCVGVEAKHWGSDVEEQNNHNDTGTAIPPATDINKYGHPKQEESSLPPQAAKLPGTTPKRRPKAAKTGLPERQPPRGI